MEAHLQAALAYIAGRLISGKNSYGVYDHSRSKRILINGTAKGPVVAVFDHDQRCHISGNGNGFQYSLYHHGEKRIISLTVFGSRFSAHDYGHSASFTGTVQGNSISLFEPATCRQFRYTLVLSLEPPWSRLAGEAGIEPDRSTTDTNGSTGLQPGT